MKSPSEFEIQRALCMWLDGVQDRRAALLPGIIYWHTPNGGSRRDAFEGARLKQSGVKPGIHDLLFLQLSFPWGKLYGLEVKDKDGELSPSQIDMHPRLLAAGMFASATVNSLAEAKAQLIKWMLTIPDQNG